MVVSVVASNVRVGCAYVNSYFHVATEFRCVYGARMIERTQAFSEIERRAMAARRTIAELCDEAEVDRTTYWRAKEGHLKRADSWVITARKLEDKLSEIERARA